MQVGRFRLARIALFSFFPGTISLATILLQTTFVSLALAQTTKPSDSQPSFMPPMQSLSQAAVPASRGNSQAKPAPSPDSANSLAVEGVTSPMLRLGPGDLLEINVYNVPELSTKARVGNSGDIYLPLIDYVHVGDLTVEEAQAVIQKRLEDGGFVRSAHVTLMVDESASNGVTILGEVSRPGIYPAVGDRRLYDFISAAGGFTNAASRKISVVHRDETTARTLELPRNLSDSLEDNIQILPGDTITIPRAPIIYVVGDVGRPAGLLVDNGSLTVLQAIALAGGPNHTAKMGSVRIIRKGPTGMTETRVPLKKMLEAKAPDVTLQADDILFVPLSGTRVAAEQGMAAAISAATGIAVIAAHP